MPLTPSSFQFAHGSEDLGTLHGADYHIDFIGTFRNDRMDKVAASSYDPTDSMLIRHNLPQIPHRLR